MKTLDDSEEFFTLVWNHRLWGRGEAESSRSGHGSSISYTKKLRESLPAVFKKFNVNTLLDVPCGDFNWMPLVLDETPWIRYIGGDVVKNIATEIGAKFPQHKFIQLNIITDSLPKADMMFCRDCLFHLTNEHIEMVFDNFLKSDIPYIMTTSHTFDSVVVHCGQTTTKNSELPPTGFRKLNLMDEPWNLPEPLDRVDDWVDGYPEREMCVWSKDQLLEWKKCRG